MKYELWDLDSGNIITATDSLNTLVQYTFELGQDNPRLVATLGAIEKGEDGLPLITKDNPYGLPISDDNPRIPNE